eukprot:466900-Prorocentrum_minimum.AAC.5
MFFSLLARIYGPSPKTAAPTLSISEGYGFAFNCSFNTFAYVHVSKQEGHPRNSNTLHWDDSPPQDIPSPKLLSRSVIKEYREGTNSTMPTRCTHKT